MRKHTTLKRGAIALASFLLVSPSVAQEFTEEHMLAARAAVEASGGLSGFDNILPNLSDQAKALFIRSNPAITEIIETTTDEVALKLASKRADLDNSILEVWASKFEIEELEQIQEFYSSPVGKKFYKLTPELANLSIQLANQWRDQLSIELFALVRDELIEKGYTP